MINEDGIIKILTIRITKQEETPTRIKMHGRILLINFKTRSSRRVKTLMKIAYKIAIIDHDEKLSYREGPFLLTCSVRNIMQF